MNEFAQLPTPMIATRTLSCRRSRPPLPFDSLTVGCLQELLADVQDALNDRDPCGEGEEHERPGQHAPRRENETRGDDDDALGARPDPHVAAEAERLGLRARVRDEE